MDLTISPPLDPVAVALAAARGREIIERGLAREIRERARLSQGEVARALQINVMSISRWENGKTRPTGEAGLVYLRLLTALEERVFPPPVAAA